MNGKSKANGKPVCLRPECERAVRTRGLCHVCYQSASKLVRVKTTSWEKLEKSGKVLAVKNGGSITDWLLDS